MDTNLIIQQVQNSDGLIFDLDGTLADTMSIHYKACQQVCNQRGFDFPLDFFYAQAGIPTKQVFCNLMIHLNLKWDGNQLGEEKELFFKTLIGEIKPIDITLKVVQHFYRKIPMAIGTGGEKETALKTLEAINCLSYFNAIVTADDVSKPKPHPETFLRCAKLMNVSPETCSVFEDGDLGIIAAKKGNMNIIDIRNYIF